MKTALNQLCVEKEGEREKRREEEREDLGGVEWEIKRMEPRREKCVNDAALLWNVSNGRQFMPQVSNTVDVMACQRKHKELWLILMYAAASLGNTLCNAASITFIHSIHKTCEIVFC